MSKIKMFGTSPMKPNVDYGTCSICNCFVKFTERQKINIKTCAIICKRC